MTSPYRSGPGPRVERGAPTFVRTPGQQEQALDWVYGNLACSTRHKPSRAAFLKVAQEEFGWSAERFEKFARGKEWLP